MSGDADGNGCAFQIESGASASVKLAEGAGNSLVSGAKRAGLEVADKASVTIDGEGSLTAKCFSEQDAHGAGIGGGYSGSAGDITITGGAVTASCEAGDAAFGAGIGGGISGGAGTVSISGGMVTALCSGGEAEGSGIGSGFDSGFVSSGGTVEIAGGTVTASCEGFSFTRGAGIGGGYNGFAASVKISGGRIKASGYESGVGGGEGCKNDPVDVPITGGLFASGIPDGKVDGNKVYGVTPAEGFAVYDSGDADYPFAVAGLAGDFKVEGGTRGTDYSYDYPNSMLEILTGTPVTISMRDGVEQTEHDRIVVPAPNKNANITLAGVDVKLSDDFDCAFEVQPGATANVKLAEGFANSLVSGMNCAGLEVSRDWSGNVASVSIDGKGSLVAKCLGGDAYGAGIGGGRGKSGGNVEVVGGTVTASSEGVAGSAFGAGIGGGYHGSAGSVRISGGEVVASSKGADAKGAGIGGGTEASGGAVEVSGGTVAASCEGASSVGGAGIGSGFGGAGVTVSISGGRIKASGYGSGIGAGESSTAGVSITGGLFAEGDVGAGTVYGIKPADGFAVRDNLLADKGDYPCAVAVPVGDFAVMGGTEGVDYSYDLLSSTLRFSTGEPMAVSMKDGVSKIQDSRILVSAGTDANITLAGVNIELSGSYDCAFEIESGASAKLTLMKDSDNFLVSGASHAGLEVTGGASVTIGGEGSLTAKCVGTSAYGAGIGGGASASVGDVAITGGTVVASCESSGNAIGAGIGAGYRGSGGIVKITGGVVIPSSGSGFAIGAGDGGSGVSVEITGGRIGARGRVEIDPTAKITGGLFTAGVLGADGNAGTVCGVEPSAGCVVLSSPFEDKARYPYAVAAPAGDFAVMGGTEGTDYSYDSPSSTLRMLTGTPMAVSMKGDVAQTTADRIVVPASNKAANVTLAGIDINLSGDNDCAFEIEPGASANVKLSEGFANSLVSGADRAGLEVSRDRLGNVASVVIDGGGSLTAKCFSKEGANGAGIGGGYGGSGGNIKISGGTVIALCEAGDVAFGAGIGGGYRGSSGNGIEITDGLVTAVCRSAGRSANGAGIGGGDGIGGEVSISGGTVDASCESTQRDARGAGIGGGDSAGGNVSISGGTVTASCRNVQGDIRGAGIGGGFCGSGGNVSISGGRISVVGEGGGIGNGGHYEGDPVDVSITGGLFGDGKVDGNTVYGVTPAAGCLVLASSAADIAAGYPYAVTGLAGDFKVDGGERDVDYSYDYPSSTLKILTGKPMTVSMRDGVAQTGRDRIVVPSSNTNADVTLAGIKVDVSGDPNDSAFAIYSGASAKLTLAKDSDNLLVSGRSRAGLEVPDGASVTIGGEGSLTAKCFGKADAYGAGIGGGANDAAGSIKITGGTVTASCESVSGSAYGAGIGGGDGGSGGTVKISGGRIRAESGSGTEISPTATITGGSFADDKAGSGVVYGVPLGEGFAVYDSGDADYRYAVAGLAGDFKVEGGTRGTDYAYDYPSSSLRILAETPVTVSMKDGIAQTERDRIVVAASSKNANVTLAGVDVKLSGGDDCAFEVQSGATANVTLAEGSDNLLVSGASRAGLEVAGEASVTIGGEGSLTAKCFGERAASGAGIGGGRAASVGDVFITGGTVAASCESGGNSNGAGIGGGLQSTGGTVSISGGTVTAACKGAYRPGAGIGSGHMGRIGSVSISGGRVNASSGEGDAIGACLYSSKVPVSITGGLFVGVLGDGASAGTVYKVKPAEGCVVRDNPFEDKDVYPYAVAAPAGDFMVVGGAQDVDYSYGSNVLELRTGTPMVVSMKAPGSTTSTDRIAVSASGKAANVTLEGVGIELSGEKDCAFEIRSGATANVTLAEGSDNLLVSGSDRAGLGVPDGASVVIDGKGSLTAKCLGDDAFGAGIGGGRGKPGGNVEVTGGTVTASSEGITGSAYGAGIGGGFGGSTGCVKILGGEVVASSKGAGISHGAGIGGGYQGSGGDVEISNGTVTASCKSAGEGKTAFGAGIGGGLNGSAGSVRISGGTVTASCESVGESAGAGIGSGFDGSGGSVEVTGGSVSATCKAPDGKALGAGIGDGFGSKTPVKVSITGGVFASDNPDADIAADKVCGASVGTFAAPRAVIANPDSVTFAAYPVTVCEKKAYAPTLAPKGGFTYDGNQLSATDFDLGAAGLLPTRDELAAAASFESKEASASEYGPEMPKNAGTYDVRATLARIVRVEDGAPVCYVASGPADVQVEIAPRQLSATVSADDPSATREYDGTTAFSGVKLDLTGVLSGDVVSAMADGHVGDAVVGDAKGFTATDVLLAGADAGNYELALSKVTGSVAITKAPLTVTAKDSTIAYGDYPKEEGVTYSGFVNNEDSNVLGGKLEFFFGDYAPGSAVGTYPIVPGGLTSDNYAITFKEGKLEVAARVLSAEVVSGTTKTYDGSVDFSGVELELGNARPGDDVSATADGSVVDSAVGTKGFTATAVHLTGLSASNYTLAPGSVTGTASITKAPLTVTANDATVAYGEEPKAKDVTYKGFVNNEGPNVLGDALEFSFGGYIPGSAVGTYPIIPSGLTAANYDINFVEGELRVAPRILSAEVAFGTVKTYDGSADFSGAELNLGNVFSDDDVSATADGNVGDPAAGDAKGFTATAVNLAGADAGNYALAPGSVTGTASITKAPLTVTASDAAVAYGDDPADKGVSYDGFVNNEGSAALKGDLVFSFGGYKAGSAVGTYPIVPAGLESGNYAITFKEGKLQVASRVLSAEVAPGTSKTYDGTPGFFDVGLVLENVHPGDDVSATADGSVVDPAVGTKDFTATAVHLNGPFATNYALVPDDVTGKASIAPRRISVSSASVASKTYDGTTDAKVSAVEFDNLVAGESLTMGQDFTATGAFESSAAGKGKRVLVEVSLVPESPVCKNYVLAEGGSSVETTGDIVQSGASLDLSVGGAGGGQGSPFLYGETMSFTVTPQAAHSLAFRSAAEPTLQLFVVGADGSEIPLCEPVEGVAEGKPTTVYYDTSKKLLPVGENIVRVRVSGMANLQEAFEDVQVLVKPKGVELFWSGLDDRVYGDGAQVSAQLVGALPTDDVRVDVSGGAETEAGGPYAATASLAGEDAPFYAIEGSAVADYSIAKVPAFDLSVPVDMKRLQPGDEASVDVAALLPEAARDASFEVASLTTEGLVSAEVDAAGILSLTSDAPAGAQRDEVEVRLSNMANCEDSKVVVTVAYVDKPVAKISNATAANDLVYNGSPQVGFAGKPVASFDGGTYEGDFKLSYEGVGDTAYGPSADAPTRAGDYVATLSVPGDEPSCAGSISLGFSIGRAPLAVTAHDATATYGEQGADAGVEFEGFVPGEGPSNLSGSLALAIEGYEAGSPAGFYPIVPSGLSSGDYLISFVPGRLEVLPKALSAKVDAGDPSASRPYDGTAAFFGVALSLEGVLPGDEVLAVADGAAERALVGDDLGFEALSVGLEGADAASYSLSPADVEGRVSISRVSLTVRAADASMVAGGQLPELGFELSGLAASDEVLAPPALSVEGDTSAPGSCSIVPSGVSVTNQDCYDVAYENGTLTVLAPEPDGGDGDGDGSGGSGDGEVPGSGGASGEDGSQPGEGSGSGGVPRPLPAPDGARQADAVLSPTGDPLSAASFVAGAIALVAGLAAALAAGRRARR